MRNAAVAAQRLRAQRLTSAPLKAPHDVVQWLGAVQSQEYAVARWSVGLRTRGSTDLTVERAYAAGTILRTHVLRPTWHFVTPGDIRWMLALTGSRVRALMASQHRRLELDDLLVAKAKKRIARALASGSHMTRAELQAALARDGIHISGQRLGHLMLLAELDAMICSGAPKGKQHTYALLDERAPKTASLTLTRDGALAELARRYFQARGPATHRDLARWATLTLSDARRALELLGRDAQRVEVDGEPWWRVGAPAVRSRAAPRALLLQVYDEYIGGYGDTRPIVDPDDLMHATPAVRTPFMHAIVLDGHVVGHWRPSAKRPGRVDIRMGTSLDTGGRSAIDEAVARYETFVRR